MLRLGLSLCALLGATLPLQAQDWFTREHCTTGEIRIWREVMSEAEEARIAASAANVPNGVGKFWQITAPGGQVSYLWGTYHVPERAILDLPQALRAALEAADVVALEFNPLPADRAEVRRNFSQDWMWIPGDLPLDQREDFPPATLSHIEQRMVTLGWDPTYLPMMTDAAVLSILLSDPCSDFTGGLIPIQDYFIAQTGWLAGADVVGLQEPWALGEELTAPHRLKAARAAALLYALYLGPDSAVRGARETGFALYLAGRLGELDALSDGWAEHKLGEARGREVVALTDGYLLVERNAIWMERIRALADQGGAVIAVGAAHLPGDLGLVSMIRDAGYKVERVVLPGEVD